MKKIILAFTILAACNNPYKTDKEVGKYETDDIKYKNGQMLLPDYAHNDILIVTNADSLNWCMENYDIESDGDINDVLHAYCKSVN